MNKPCPRLGIETRKDDTEEIQILQLMLGPLQMLLVTCTEPNANEQMRLGICEEWHLNQALVSNFFPFPFFSFLVFFIWTCLVFSALVFSLLCTSFNFLVFSSYLNFFLSPLLLSSFLCSLLLLPTLYIDIIWFFCRIIFSTLQGLCSFMSAQHRSSFSWKHPDQEMTNIGDSVLSLTPALFCLR